MTKSNKRARSRKLREQRQQAAANPAEADAGSITLDPPFGYTRGEDGELSVNDDELEVLTQIRALADKRMHVKAIAAKLREDDVKCRDHAWTPKLVTKLLRRKVDSIDQDPTQRR